LKAARFATPEGSLVVQPSKNGLLMGNRGKLGPILQKLPQPHAKGKNWIACILEKDGVTLPKTDVAYTRLFFLDEVTALAAGHRPCWQCQPERYNLFVDFWRKAIRKDSSDFDERLHSDRCHEDGSKKTFSESLCKLPSGVMVRLPESSQPYLLLWGKLFPWSIDGYGTPITLPLSASVVVLTPSVIVQMFKAGFPLLVNRKETIHPSILGYL
jgi:hypothetical protein